MTISLGPALLQGSSERPFPRAFAKGICSCTGGGLPRTVVTNGRVPSLPLGPAPPDMETLAHFSPFIHLADPSISLRIIRYAN